MARPPRIPNWLPAGQTSIYFMTFCTRPRKDVLANERAWKISLEILQRLNQWRLLAAIAMPDHLHILTAPQDREASVAAYSKWFKRWFNERYWTAENCRPPVSDGTAAQVGATRTWRWQEGCFDRLLRSDESFSDKWAYLRENPVRAGLIAHSQDWPYQYACNIEDGKL